MKFFKYIFLCSLLFPLSCGKQGKDTKDDPYKDYYDTRRDDDTRRGDSRRQSSGSCGDLTNRDDEISRLKRRSDKISAELEHRFDGGFYYDAYDGEECEESEACMEICDSFPFARRNRKKCHNSPRALVEKLEDGVFTLLNICEADSVDISPGLIAGMLDMDVDEMADLVEDKMSEGDLKSFLAWVAVNEDIAEVFLKEDRRSEIMEKAFKKLGKLQPEVENNEETGLNVGLIQSEDSFFHLSAYESNSAAFQIGYEVLKSVCSSKDCKMNLLCARDSQSRSRRSRIFGRSSNITECRTSSEQGRRARSSGFCYIHGAVSWNYLNELIEDRDIRDNDFVGEENEITVEKCNEYCDSRDRDNEKCTIVQ